MKSILTLIPLFFVSLHAMPQCNVTLTSGSTICPSSLQYGVIESAPNPCGFDCDMNYNCHQYVRAALVNGLVNLGCGKPNQGPLNRNPKLSNLPSGNIKHDVAFIKLCNSSGAQAVSFIGIDHSALILSSSGYPTGYYAAKPSGISSDPLYYMSNPQWAAGGCNYEYFSYVGNVQLVGSTSSMVTGEIRTFQLLSLPSFISSVTWSVESPYLSVLSQNNTSITVQANCNGASGSFLAKVKATFGTGCGTARERQINFNVSCLNPCAGKINGNTLNTVNGVPANYQNTVQMDGAGPYTWTKTSGPNIYWYTASNGKFLYFSLPSGTSANFNVQGMGCNRTVGFATSYFLMADTVASITEESEKPIVFRVFDFHGKTIKVGVIKPEEEKELLIGIPPGLYILERNNRRKKIAIVD